MKAKIWSYAAAIASLMVFAVLQGSAPAAAQDAAYPTKYIRVLSPFAAGGLTDTALRPLLEKLSKSLGQQLIVENRAGASGLIAGRGCATAAPDGYTICILHNDAVTNAPFLYKSVGYDPFKDLVPITNNYITNAVIAVNGSLKVSNLKEFIELSKARPQGLKYASLSTMIKGFMDRFSEVSGASLTAVPYKGGADATLAIVSGSVDAIFAGAGNLLPQIESGQVKVLAIEGDTRSPTMPDVPTIKEAGVNIDRARNWFGFFAPAGTPPAIVQKLHASIIAAYQEDPEFTKRTLISNGLQPVLNTPSEFASFLKSESVKSEAEFKRAGIEPQ